MATAASTNKKARLVGLLSIILGAVFVLAGVVTWGAITSQLSAENITVSKGAPFEGAKVADPVTAFVQANVINGHSLEATGGKTYAELGKDDPLRTTAMTASFLRASLFTSVIAYGVALFAIGVGVLAILLGWGFRAVGSAATRVADAPAGEPMTS